MVKINDNTNIIDSYSMDFQSTLNNFGKASIATDVQQEKKWKFFRNYYGKLCLGKLQLKGVSALIKCAVRR